MFIGEIASNPILFNEFGIDTFYELRMWLISFTFFIWFLMHFTKNIVFRLYFCAKDIKQKFRVVLLYNTLSSSLFLKVRRLYYFQPSPRQICKFKFQKLTHTVPISPQNIRVGRQLTLPLSFQPQLSKKSPQRYFLKFKFTKKAGKYTHVS